MCSSGAKDREPLFLSFGTAFVGGVTLTSSLLLLAKSWTPQDEDFDGGLGTSHFRAGSSDASGVESSDGDDFTSDDDGYPRRRPNISAFGRTRVDAFGKPLTSGSGHEWFGPSAPHGSPGTDAIKFHHEPGRGERSFAWDSSRLVDPGSVNVEDEVL